MALKSVTLQKSLIGVVLGSVLFVSLPVIAIQSVSKPNKPKDVMDLLDCVAQPRFQLDDDRFGLSRLITIPGHEAVRHQFGKAPSEIKFMKAVESWNKSYIVGFLSVDTPPTSAYRTETGLFMAKSDEEVSRRLSLRQKDFRPTLTAVVWPTGVVRSGSVSAGVSEPTGPEEDTLDYARLNKLARANFAEAKKGTSFEKSSGDWEVGFRPVKATKAACLGCHKLNKAGDTLGVMVYAVSRVARKSDPGSVATPH